LRDIIYIVEQEIVDKMDCNVEVTGIVSNDLTVCDPKWAAFEHVVMDSIGGTFTVSAVNHNINVITLIDATGFTGNMVLKKPYFFVGTPRATNAEWEDFALNLRDKLPAIWMVEPTAERPNYDPKSPIERESDVRLEFIDTNDTTNWITTKTHSIRLQSLYNMYTEFVKVINKNPLFNRDRLTEGKIKNLTKFGTETKSGFKDHIIDANLTGLDTRLTLVINKGECKC
jgi:hypothetical protein